MISSTSLNLKRRSAISRTCEHAEPSALADFLAHHPDQTEVIESEAKRLYEMGRGWHSLLLALGLVMAKSPSGLVVLEQVLKHGLLSPGPPIPWDRLTEKQINSLTDYLISKGAVAELERLLKRLNDDQIKALHIGYDHPEFLDCLKILLKFKKPLDPMIDELMQVVEQEAETSRAALTNASPALDRCQQAIELIQAAGRFEDTLGPLTVLSLSGIRIPDGTLKRIADEMSGMSDNGIARAADLLRRFPSREWIQALKEVWLSLEADVRVDSENPLPDSPDPVLDAAANAVASALGACAACDPLYRNFAEDNDLNRQQQGAFERYYHLIKEHKDLIKQYKDTTGQKQRSVLEERLYKHSQEIKRLDQVLREFFIDLTPGYLLLHCLLSSENYPVSVLQGAAWGLHLLRVNGNFDEQTKAELFDALRKANEAKAERKFCERHIRLLPGRSRLELTGLLQDGLRWVEQLIEGEYAPAPASATFAGPPEEYSRLREVVWLLCELIPGALDFLGQYPLRLMPLDHHKRILGNYSSTGGALTYWTRYTPPKNSGPVHSRYLSVEDRSTPNSMGIYYKLFRHPVLALPVIYHEFLHYGGPTGDPKQGIENETEVLLRELIFARNLIAELAPADDRALPTYEESLLQEISQTELESLRWQLTYDFQDDTTLENINREIINLYGDQLSEEEIERLWSERLVGENQSIDVMNAQLTWAPQIKYPKLGTTKTATATKHYRELFKRQRMRSHRVSPPARDRILQNEPCASQTAAWESYLKRPQTRLAQPPALSDNLIRLIARRFDFRDAESDLAQLLLEHFLQSYDLGGEKNAPDNEAENDSGKPRTVVSDYPIVGRNDPCPCGSGKKYRKCHGAESLTRSTD